MASLMAQMSCGAENCEIGAFSASAGEDDFTRLAGKDTGDAVSGVIQPGAGASADTMDAGRIAPVLVQEREHGSAHPWVERGSGVVIEIDGLHRHRMRLHQEDDREKTGCGRDNRRTGK